jgi:Ser/Thr protein kinase RdoA (MazF antagonist)
LERTKDVKAINAPDFGEVYANPVYYLARDLPRLEAECPISFVHGDLNLQNVLFNIGTDNSIDLDPIFIDFRHASQSGLAILDLAKLESCIRYQILGKVESLEDLSQRVTFLAATRERLEFGNPPEVITDKRLQDHWRCLQQIRSAYSSPTRKS